MTWIYIVLFLCDILTAHIETILHLHQWWLASPVATPAFRQPDGSAAVDSHHDRTTAQPSATVIHVHLSEASCTWKQTEDVFPCLRELCKMQTSQ